MSALNRRDVLKTLVATGVASAGFAWPALAQNEEVVPFIDVPAPTGPNARRPPSFDKFITANEEFFSVQHYNVPTIDAATYRLRITGLVDRPIEISLDEIRRRPRLEQIVGFECSGNNNARANPLVGNARWTGTRFADLLKAAGLRPTAREVVCFGADGGSEDVTHGGAPVKVDQHFGRGLSIPEAMQPEIMLAYEMNGVPLPQGHGGPLRLIVPGWYGVANVKWLNRIHLQDARFVGRFMGRDYVTLRGDGAATDPLWNETLVSRVRLKSAIGRVTRAGSTATIIGFALTDGTPLRSVEIKVDDGQWRPATMARDNTTYSWQLFTYRWTGVTAGEHTLVSRAIDARGEVQPEQDDPNKKSRWENNAQFVRKVRV